MKKNDFQQHVIDEIKRICGHKNMIVIPAAVLNFTDDLREAAFLSQLIYWCDKGKSLEGYIYKSENEWFKEIRLTRYMVIKAARKLEADGMLDVMKKRANGSPTLHYKLNREVFFDKFFKFLKMETEKFQNVPVNNEVSITEPISETKTEIGSGSLKKRKDEKDNGKEFSRKGKSYLDSIGIKPSFE